MDNCGAKDAAAILEERVADLDAFLDRSWSSREPKALIDHFVKVMAQYTGAYMSEVGGGRPVVRPERADDAVSESRLLMEIGERRPDLATGPVDLANQRWTSTARKSLVPSRERFLAPSSQDALATPPPLAFGFYTSTATGPSSSMWTTYMTMYHGLTFPEPWRTWEVTADPATVRVAELTSARAWVELVERYPKLSGEIATPDWSALAADFDGVHVTVTAVAASHGFRCESAVGPVAAPFWDVEQTLWLRWPFTCIREIEAPHVRVD